MVDIVVRDLTVSEARHLRILKAELGERNWRTMLLRLLSEWENNTRREQEKII